MLLDYDTGIVKWFDKDAGYGYIECANHGDIYVHYSAILCDENICSLREGSRVRFRIFDGPKGPQAQDVIVLS